MAHGDFKDLARSTASYNVLRNKRFNIAKYPKYDEYQRGPVSTVYKFFDKKTSGCSVNNEIKQNQQLAEELNKPIIRTFLKRKVYSSFKGNIWGVHLADMQLISKYNKGIRFLLCVIDIFSNYAWTIPLKDKRGITIGNAFKKN